MDKHTYRKLTLISTHLRDVDFEQNTIYYIYLKEALIENSIPPLYISLILETLTIQIDHSLSFEESLLLKKILKLISSKMTNFYLTHNSDIYFKSLFSSYIKEFNILI